MRSAYPTLSRRHCQDWFNDGQVKVETDSGSRVARKGEVLEAGSKLMLPQEPPRGILADKTLPLCVVHLTQHYVVVNKSAGVPSAPLRPSEIGTVASALVHRFPQMQQIGYSCLEPGLVHRLDVGTSGLLMAARSGDAFKRLTKALRAGEFDKRYLAVVQAELPVGEFQVTSGICPHPTDPRKVIGTDRGRSFTTKLKVLSRFEGRQLVEARASAAYRHQVRLHLSSIGAPLLGDSVYGGDWVEGLKWHALHAHRLAWRGSNEIPGFDVQEELPDSLKRLLK